jgi:hypothetical protein
MTMKRSVVTGLFAVSLVLPSAPAFAAGQYGPGASDTEIKIGNTMPYSGPVSAYGVIGKTEGPSGAFMSSRPNSARIPHISGCEGKS